ncbi:hypothetical protein Hanom_Chr16g01522391 [Helianthus anomalus]
MFGFFRFLNPNLPCRWPNLVSDRYVVFIFYHWFIHRRVEHVCKCLVFFRVELYICDCTFIKTISFCNL